MNPEQEAVGIMQIVIAEYAVRLGNTPEQAAKDISLAYKLNKKGLVSRPTIVFVKKISYALLEEMLKQVGKEINE